MAAKFYTDINEDERRDWRQGHVTRLAIDMLHELQADAATDVLNAAPEQHPQRTAFEKGYHAAIGECIELLTRDSE